MKCSIYNCKSNKYNMITVREFRNILNQVSNDWNVKFITGECPNYETLQVKTISDFDGITKAIFEPTDEDVIDVVIPVDAIRKMFVNDRNDYDLISMMHTNDKGQIFDSIIEVADLGYSDKVVIVELIDR